jgi:hypothetical protein
MLALILPLLLLTISLSFVLFLLYTDSESIKQALVTLIFPSARKVQIHLAKNEIQAYVKTRVAPEHTGSSSEALDTEDSNPNIVAKSTGKLRFRNYQKIDNGAGSVKKSKLTDKFTPKIPANAPGQPMTLPEEKIPIRNPKRFMRSFVGLVKKHREMLRGEIVDSLEELYNPCQVFYKIRCLEHRIWQERRGEGYSFLKPIFEGTEEDDCVF